VGRLLAVAAAGLLGVAGSAQGEVRSVPPGLTVRTVPGYATSIAVPSSWVGGAPPAATAVLGVKYVYRDPVAISGFRANLNVVVTPLPRGYTLRQWFFGGASAAYQYVGTTTNETIGGVPGLHYVSTKATRYLSQPLLTDEYAVVRNGNVFLFTYTALASTRSRYEKLFGESASSIRFF
jgi:hypothetical protein